MREGVPIDPSRVPPEVMEYSAVIQSVKDHEMVQRFFRQITSLVLGTPPRTAEMWLPEFRDGYYAALVWHDEEMNWGTGGWLRIAHIDGDIVCPPSPLTIQYFQNAKAFRSMTDVLDHLLATKPSE